jgi:aspartate kinase
MVEMAFAGAGIVHPRAVELAAMYELDIHVGSSLDNGIGTLVLGGGRVKQLETRNVVIAVAHDVESVVFRVSSPMSDNPLDTVLGVLSDRSAAADMLTQSVADGTPYVSFTVGADVADEVRVALSQAGLQVRADESAGKVSIVGTGLLSRPDVTARVTRCLARAGVAVTHAWASQSRSSVIVPRARVADAVNLLHTEFELDREDT